MARTIVLKPKKIQPEYLTVKECQAICRFTGPEPIRRAVYRGDLPGVRITANKLLIPAKDFWKWFHRRDVKIKKAPDIDLLEPRELKKIPA